jgi:hypothetical protein
MGKNQTYLHSNLFKINSYCRSRRRKNPTGISEQQQKIHQQIAAKTVEFFTKVQTLHKKLNEVKNHVKQTKSRLNSLRHYLD